MSLKHILLGLLEEPNSGYDVKQYFNQVFKHFWAAELAQIYPALAKLEKDGLAGSEQQASDKGPTRRVYQRTTRGTRAHKQWLKNGPIVGKDRLPYLTQTFFLGDIPAEDRLQFFRDLRAHFAAELVELRAVVTHWSGEDPGYPDQMDEVSQAQQFTLRLGLKKMVTNVEWCDECIAVIESRAAGDGP